MIYGTGYANSQVYRPRIWGFVTAGNPPYTITITGGTFYSCGISHGTYYSLDIASGTLYTLETEH